MKKQNRPEEEARKTLEVLDQLQRVKGSPELFDRIQKEFNQPPRSTARVVSFPSALKIAAAIALIAVNIFAFRANLAQQPATNSLSEMLANDYGLSIEDTDLFTNQ